MYDLSFCFNFYLLGAPPTYTRGSGNRTQGCAIDKYKIKTKIWFTDGMEAQAWVIHAVEFLEGWALPTHLKNSGDIVFAWVRFEKI